MNIMEMNMDEVITRIPLFITKNELFLQRDVSFVGMMKTSFSFQTIYFFYPRNHFIL